MKFSIGWFILKIIVYPFTWILFPFKVVSGRKNEPKNTGYVAVSNHTSALDPILMGYIVRAKPRYMAKKELFRRWYVSALIRSLGAFPIDRSKTDLNAFKTAMRSLKNGKALVMFPEGTRVTEEEGSEAKRGAALFAYKAKVPVLPVYIYPRNKKGKVCFFRKTGIKIGEPITPEELNVQSTKAEDLDRASEYIMSKVYELKDS